jgi:hypothetical protein
VLKKSADLASTLWLRDDLERAVYSLPAHLRGGGHNRFEFCEFPEVLGGCGESKFVLDTTWAT